MNWAKTDPPQPDTYMSFDTQEQPNGTPTSGVDIAYADWSLVQWAYDAENGRYWRWVDGEPFTDQNTGEQVSAANLVLLPIIHHLDRSICIYHDADVCTGWPTEIQLWGQGGAVILRDGQRYNVTWLRQARNDMLTFIDENGDPFPLQIGNTWVQVIPNYLDNPVTYTEP